MCFAKTTLLRLRFYTLMLSHVVYDIFVQFEFLFSLFQNENTCINKKKLVCYVIYIIYKIIIRFCIVYVRSENFLKLIYAGQRKI